MFEIEFNPNTLEPIILEQGFLRFLNDWNADPVKAGIVDSHLIISAAHCSTPSQYYLTLLNKNLEIVDQDKTVLLKDSESLISFDSSGQIISFSDQNCFLIHRIDQESNKLILKKTISLDQEIREIRFSEHLNVPRTNFMALFTDKEDNYHLLEIKHDLDSLELVEPGENSFVQDG